MKWLGMWSSVCVSLVTQIGDTKIHSNLPQGRKTPGSVKGSVASVPPDPALVEPSGKGCMLCAAPATHRCTSCAAWAYYCIDCFHQAHSLLSCWRSLEGLCNCSLLCIAEREVWILFMPACLKN